MTATTDDTFGEPDPSQVAKLRKWIGADGDDLEVVSAPDLSAILLSDYTSAMADAAEARQTIAELQARLRLADAMAKAVSAFMDVGEGGLTLVEWDNAFDAVQAAHAAYLHGPQPNEVDDE